MVRGLASMYRHTSAIMCFVIYMLTYGCKSDASHASTYNTSKHAQICLQIFASNKDEGKDEGKEEGKDEGKGEGAEKKDKGKDEGKDEGKEEGAEKKAELDLRSFDTLQTVC